MPIVVGGSATPASGTSLHGVGSGRRVVGRVVRFASLAAAAFVGAGDVVVVRAVTPALAVFIGRCAALVSETGGLLDHGAALARELGIPCVVGCRDAWTRLTDGMVVAVDGDAGQITTIS
jgi:pyruvate,water dikinase